MLSTNFQRLSWLIFSQKGNHTSLNEVKSSLQSFSEWLMLPHGTFPPSPQASPFLSPHRSPQPADPTDTPTGWGNLARQGRSTAGPEAWLWTSPRSVSVCSSLGTLFLGFFFFPSHFPFITITCNEILISNVLFINKLTWWWCHKCHGLRIWPFLQGPPASVPWFWESGVCPSCPQLQGAAEFLLKDSEEKLLLLLATERQT